MKVYQWHEVQSLAVKQVGKPAVYVSNGLEYRTPHDNEIFECVREGMKELFGDLTDEYFQALCGLITSGLFFFDTIEEQYRFYRVFEQPLVDSSPIYACTYNAQGECMTENT